MIKKPRRSGSAVFLVAAMCTAQVLGMLGVFAFPALLPHFMDLWGLSNSQAGWINGIYFCGYSIAVPILTTLTDRMDSRGIYLGSCLISLAANTGFALYSQGFWTALIFRGLCGIGLAGTFIPGLKALIDRLETRAMPRAIAFYTACFGLGMSVSFYYSGTVFRLAGWKSVFFISAMCSGMVFLFSLVILPPKPVDKAKLSIQGILNTFDFRPVWHNTSARTYIIAYACHMWEMFAARSWMVVFLTHAMAVQGVTKPIMNPATVMAVAGVFGMAASILFGELAVRFGRRRVTGTVMAISALLGSVFGFLETLPIPALIGLCVIYTFFFQGDSAAIHAGVITAAEPDRRGATMALQSMAGFTFASISPIAAGIVLDLSGGGTNTLSWGLTFWAMAASGFAGLILICSARAIE